MGPRTDTQTHTQTRVTAIHFVSSTTHAKRNQRQVDCVKVLHSTRRKTGHFHEIWAVQHQPVTFTQFTATFWNVMRRKLPWWYNALVSVNEISLRWTHNVNRCPAVHVGKSSHYGQLNLAIQSTDARQLYAIYQLVSVVTERQAKQIEHVDINYREACIESS